MLDLIVAAGLVGLLLYGFLHWRASGEPFPADMRGSTVEIARRGYLLAGHTDPRPAPEDPGTKAVQSLAQEIGVDVRWVRAPATDLLRLLESDSLDVVARYDASLPGAKAFGLTRPYTESGDSRLVLAVPAGENRLLRLADRASMGASREAAP